MIGTRLRRGTFRALTAAALALSAVQVQADSLADALIGAYTHSGLLDQNRALLRVADENVAQAQALLKPILNYEATLSRTWTRNGVTAVDALGQSALNRTRTSATNLQLSLVATWLLYDFGASNFRIEAQKEAVLATRAQLLSLEQRILLTAIQAFFDVRQGTEAVALRQNNLRLLTQELRAARDRFEVGEVTRTDVALAEARLAEARSGLASAQGQLARAEAAYIAVTGRRPGALSPPPPLPSLQNNIDAAIASALRTHPDMEAAQRAVTQAEATLAAAEKDLQPTVTFNSRLSVTENLGGADYNQNASVGVTLGGPIYRGGRLSSLIRQAMANRDAARGGLHDTRHNIARDVRFAYADFASATASIEASQRQIRAARVAFRGVREEATLGARTTLDVLDAEQELLDSQNALIVAQAQQSVAAYAILQSTGRLTARDLRLNVQLYDPEAYYNLVKDGPALRSKQGQQLDRVLRKLQKD